LSRARTVSSRFRAAAKVPEARFDVAVVVFGYGGGKAGETKPPAVPRWLKGVCVLGGAGGFACLAIIGHGQIPHSNYSLE